MELTTGGKLFCKIFKCCCFRMIPSIFTKGPTTLCEKQPQHTMGSPPNFMVSFTFDVWSASIDEAQYQNLQFDSTRFIFYLSDHITPFQSFTFDSFKVLTNTFGSFIFLSERAGSRYFSLAFKPSFLKQRQIVHSERTRHKILRTPLPLSVQVQTHPYVFLILAVKFYLVINFYQT